MRGYRAGPLVRWTMTSVTWTCLEHTELDERAGHSRARGRRSFVAGEWDNESDENAIEQVTLAYEIFRARAVGALGV